MTINISTANHIISCNLRYDDTAGFFGGFAVEEDCVPDCEVQSDEKLIETILKISPEVENYSCAEFNALAYSVSKALLPLGSVIFHGCAFVWKERAWIFTAPSGTGKTTQYVQWKRRYGNEIEILNGDKPIISVEGGKVNVYCSPWKGKERMGKPVCAPLGGIIVLNQSDENELIRLDNHAAAPYLYRRFVLNGIDSAEMKILCSIEEKMLENAPVWLLKNKGDISSAILTHDELEKFIG